MYACSAGPQTLLPHLSRCRGAAETNLVQVAGPGAEFELEIHPRDVARAELHPALAQTPVLAILPDLSSQRHHMSASSHSCVEARKLPACA